MTTRIEWVRNADGTKGETWNPVTGCTKVSPGCAHCYAEAMARRLQRMGQANYRRGFEVTTHPHMLDRPLRWRKPRRVFVCSMSDLFHPNVPTDFVHQVFDVMCRARQHTFQVLTKRPERIEPVLYGAPTYYLGGGDLLPNVWIGTTIEDQRRCIERLPHLLPVPAAVRFVSVEPQLELVDIPEDQLLGLDWVICGAESRGPRAGRPFNPDWARWLRDQCQAAGVAFFYKQGPAHGGGRLEKVPLLDGRRWEQLPTARGSER